METKEINAIGALKANVTEERNILKEVFTFLNQFEVLEGLQKRGVKIRGEEKKLLEFTIASLLLQLRMINNSIPEITKKIFFFKELPSQTTKPTAPTSMPAEKPEEKKENLISLKYKGPYLAREEGTFLIIKKSDRLRFLKELSLAHDSIKRLKKDYKLPIIAAEEFKKPSFYAKISNRFFSDLSRELIEKGYFKGMSEELRKANLYFLSHTYISMAFFSSVLAFFAAIFLLILLLFFELSIYFPFLINAEASIFSRLLRNFWLLAGLPILTFLAFYFYPLTERKSIANKINQELPFVAIHMSAVAGSGIEPTKIFRIVVGSKEYPNTAKELKKLLNEINVYGFDLVTALRNTARITASSKLSELFNGLATTITSGGKLKGFLDKRAETLVFDYRMEREKYTRVAETFMDIYISVVIAAPMIMTMILVMMSVINLGIGLSATTLSFLIVLGVALINIFFLVFLHLKQPPG